jgi:predicted dehydrogenase
VKKPRITRRRFGQAAAASAFAFTYVPKRAFGANDRFNVAGIGVGGQGGGDVKVVEQAGGTIVALCDVDGTRGASSIKRYPDAKVYQDFRVLLEKEKGIDGVIVSTPDHTHAVAAMAAMALGKHVRVQKPLTQSIYEARALAKAAEHYRVQTQMGNQAHGGEPIRRAVELVREGIIGPVREVHAWTNRPIWPQGQAAIDERAKNAATPKPADLDWDLWLGPAPERPYNACYAPFKWRGWWDFGTGALGDMACHIMDMPYWALDLGEPETVEAESQGSTREVGPNWSTIVYRFAARQSVGGGAAGGAVGPKAKVEQPAVKFVWYDGVKDGRANAPHDLLARATEEVRAAGGGDTAPPAGTGTPAAATGKGKPPKAIDDPGRWDLILVGDAGLMLFQRGSTEWIVTPRARAAEFGAVPQSIARVSDINAEWIAACRGGPKPAGAFDYSGPFTEMVLLGTLAVRLGEKITWDAASMKVAGVPAADELIRRPYRKGWELPLPPGVSLR